MIQALIQEKGLAHCACLVVVREKLFFGSFVGRFWERLETFFKIFKKSDIKY